MKIFMITDTHFGIYSGNNLEKWLKMMEDYFYNFFIPFLKKNVKEGDVLFHLGDLYDDRNSIPIICSYKAEKILKDISKILPIHMIVGNHDLWNKGGNEINSVRLFNYVDNINVYYETTTLNYEGKKMVLMPWQETKDEMISEIDKNQGDYLFCHSDLNGCRMHLNSVAHRNYNKIDVENFSKYKHVFSGHIHIRQKNKNFTFIGSPYQMDRNDTGDRKGITVLDVKSGKTEFIENTYSPEFRKLEIKSSTDIDLLNKNINSKDYIDLSISNSLLIEDRKTRRKIEQTLDKGNFSNIDYINDLIEEDEEDVIMDENVSINLDYKEFIEKYIKNKNYKKKTESGILNVYKEVINIFQKKKSGEY